MKMAETPFAKRFAMLRDRFGTSWMLLHEAQADRAAEGRKVKTQGGGIASAVVIGCLVTPAGRGGAAVGGRDHRRLHRRARGRRDGNLYFTDIINQRIIKLGVDGVLSVFRESSNAANGVLIDPQGRLIACEGAAFERPGVKVTGTPRVTRTDLRTGEVEVLADGYEGKPFTGPTT